MNNEYTTLLQRMPPIQAKNPVTQAAIETLTSPETPL
jgi:hypothetical protein